MGITSAGCDLRDRRRHPRRARSSRRCRPAGRRAGASRRSCWTCRSDFDELTKAGSMMGSGGMIVMDEDTCMVDVARYFIDFLTDESCGKCVPCREGLRQMHEILTNITRGQGRRRGHRDPGGSGRGRPSRPRCAPWARRAPNPFLSTIRYFRDEYEAHIKEKRCPALVCKALIAYYIDPEKCKACTAVLRNCPAERHRRRQEAGSTSSTRRSAPVRRLPRGLPLPLRRGEEDLRRAGSAAPIPEEAQDDHRKRASES